MIVYDVPDLVKVYPNQPQPANNHLTFQVAQGEVFGLLGDNGAGKTTLVRQMANLLRSTAGSIHLYGQAIASDPTLVAMNVGYTPQDAPALNNIPPERLPAIMSAVGRLSPATYAASALRQTLLGPVTAQLAVDLGVLAIVAALVFWLVGRFMDWRAS